ncbi:MAG: hypothetical protein ABSB33_04930 [Tepidisphaeraceae bacterium]
MNILFRYTLKNVIFGITLMVLIAAYIAIGSGVPSVREYFEMNELQFFNAWPLKALMLLLCLNLVVVTTTRIPLTPPRYGVWCIHAGIIVLITGTSLYYHLKVEGKTLIPLGHTVNLFYDSGQRALYARVLKGEAYGMHPLPSLPRYGSYDDAHDPDRLRRKDLTGINSFIPIGLPSNSSNVLSSWLGVSQPVTLDVVGYYSYADVVEDVVDDPSSTATGVEVDVNAARADGPSRFMLRATDPTASHQFFGPTELEYRQVSPDSLAMIRESADRLFELSAALPDEPPRKLDVGIGKPAEVGAYTITVDAYDPAFQLFGSDQRAAALTLHIVHKTAGGAKEFWRMILMGRALQTDFKMDPATTPPLVKGNRQKAPIDPDLVLGFRVTDAAALLPTGGDDKHVLLSAGDRTLVDIHTTFSNSAEVRDFTSGGVIELSLDGSPVTANVRRKDHFRVLTHVEQTPPHQRNKDEDEAGSKQVAVVRVRCGVWSEDVVMPCDLYAAPDPMLLEPMVAWTMGVVQIPGASAPLQLQLGYTPLPMPAALKLQRFDMIPYPGGLAGNGMFRDFCSTLVMTDASGQTETAQASLNSPIYFDHGSWIFFQAGYDPDGQSSTIGVGNRPGVGIMLTGCIMIVSGFLYAFYIKPIVIRRMKATALAKAKGKTPRVASATGAA